MEERTRKILDILNNPPTARLLLDGSESDAVSILKKDYGVAISTAEWREIRKQVLYGGLTPRRMNYPIIKYRSVSYRVGFFLSKILKICFFVVAVVFLLYFCLGRLS